MAKSYSIASQIKSSQYKHQGTANIIGSGILAIFMYLVLDRAGVINGTADITGRHSMLMGVATPLIIGAAIPLGFISLFWGRLAFVVTILNIIGFAILYFTNQSQLIVRQAENIPFLSLIFLLEAFVFCVVLLVVRDQYMRSLSESDDSNFRAAHADWLLQPVMFNRMIVGSNLADRVQDKLVRRIITTALILCFVGWFILMFIGFNDVVKFPDNIPPNLRLIEKLAYLYGDGAKTLIWTLLMLPGILLIPFQMSLRPLMALDLNPLDERQVQVIRNAHADGKTVAQWSLGFTCLLLLFKFSTTVIIPIACIAFLFTWLTPYFVMAWNLDNEDIIDEEDDIDFDAERVV